MTAHKTYAYHQNSNNGLLVAMPTPEEHEGRVEDKSTLYLFAHSAAQANKLAEALGIYWWPESRTHDCDHCSPRWDKAEEGYSEEEEAERARPYGTTPT